MLKKLLILFENKVIEAQSQKVIIKTLMIFQETSLDFIDCLLIAYHAIENKPVYSFDRKMNNYIKRMTN